MWLVRDTASIRSKTKIKDKLQTYSGSDLCGPNSLCTNASSTENSILSEPMLIESLLSPLSGSNFNCPVYVRIFSKCGRIGWLVSMCDTAAMISLSTADDVKDRGLQFHHAELSPCYWPDTLILQYIRMRTNITNLELSKLTRRVFIWILIHRSLCIINITPLVPFNQLKSIHELISLCIPIPTPIQLVLLQIRCISKDSHSIARSREERNIAKDKLMPLVHDIHVSALVSFDWTLFTLPPRLILSCDRAGMISS